MDGSVSKLIDLLGYDAGQFLYVASLREMGVI